MEEIDLKDFLSYLKKYVIFLIVAALVAVVVTFFYDTVIKTPLYSTYTKVLLIQNNEESTTATTTLNDINVNQKLAATYSEFVKSRLVLQQVIDRLHLDYTVEQLAKNISVTNVADTQVLKITVTDTDPERARQIADTTTSIFAKEITSITGLDNVRPYESAQSNDKPSNNTLSRDVVIAALIGIFGVLAVAFVIYYFDDSIKYSEDLEQRLGVPVVGKIVNSDVNLHRGRSNDELIVQRYPKSAVSECIKALRTNLQFTSVDKGFQTILITSSVSSEGKSFVSSNLAISFAQSGRRTLIVDCDLRKGRLHHIFHAPNIRGYSHLLTDKIGNFIHYIQKTSIDNLYIMTRGTYPPNPSELLGSSKNKDLVKLLKQYFDIIIFDGAPSNSVTDSIIMSTLVDEVLIVTKDSNTSKTAFFNAKDMLAKVNAPIAGVVMNGINKKVANYYGYYGYYGSKEATKEGGSSDAITFEEVQSTSSLSMHNAAKPVNATNVQSRTMGDMEPDIEIGMNSASHVQHRRTAATKPATTTTRPRARK